jgi:hypothetical protein
LMLLGRYSSLNGHCFSGIMSFGRQKTYFKIDCRIYGMKMSAKARLTVCIVCLLHMVSFTGTIAARVGRRNVSKTQTTLDHTQIPTHAQMNGRTSSHTHTHRLNLKYLTFQKAFRITSVLVSRH